MEKPNEACALFIILNVPQKYFLGANVAENKLFNT